MTLAQRNAAPDKADEALAWLQLSLEYFPLSNRTSMAISQVQQRKNDKDGAIKSLEKALVLAPNDAQATRLLDHN